MNILKRFWHWLRCEDSNGNPESSVGICLGSKCFGYRVQIYQKERNEWNFKSTGLYSYCDASSEAEKIYKETGKKTRVLEYWETNKIVKEFM